MQPLPSPEPLSIRDSREDRHSFTGPTLAQQAIDFPGSGLDLADVIAICEVRARRLTAMRSRRPRTGRIIVCCAFFTTTLHPKGQLLDAAAAASKSWTHISLARTLPLVPVPSAAAAAPLYLLRTGSKPRAAPVTSRRPWLHEKTALRYHARSAVCLNRAFSQRQRLSQTQP